MAKFDLNEWRDDIQALQQQLAVYIPKSAQAVKSAQEEQDAPASHGGPDSDAGSDAAKGVGKAPFSAALRGAKDVAKRLGEQAAGAISPYAQSAAQAIPQVADQALNQLAKGYGTTYEPGETPRKDNFSRLLRGLGQGVGDVVGSLSPYAQSAAQTVSQAVPQAVQVADQVLNQLAKDYPTTREPGEPPPPNNNFSRLLMALREGAAPYAAAASNLAASSAQDAAQAGQQALQMIDKGLDQLAKGYATTYEPGETPRKDNFSRLLRGLGQGVGDVIGSLSPHAQSATQAISQAGSQALQTVDQVLNHLAKDYPTTREPGEPPPPNNNFSRLLMALREGAAPSAAAAYNLAASRAQDAAQAGQQALQMIDKGLDHLAKDYPTTREPGEPPPPNNNFSRLLMTLRDKVGDVAGGLASQAQKLMQAVPTPPLIPSWSELGEDAAARMGAQMFGESGMAPDTPKGSVAPPASLPEPVLGEDLASAASVAPWPAPAVLGGTASTGPGTAAVAPSAPIGPAAPSSPHPDDIFGDPLSAVASSSGASGTGPSAVAPAPAASPPSPAVGGAGTSPSTGGVSPAVGVSPTSGAPIVLTANGTPHEMYTVDTKGSYKNVYEQLSAQGITGANAARVIDAAQRVKGAADITDRLGLSDTGVRVIVEQGGKAYVLKDVSDKGDDYWQAATLGSIPSRLRGLLGYGDPGRAFQFGSQLAGTAMPPWAMGMFNPYFNFMMGPMGMNPMGIGMFMDPMMMYMLMMGMSGMFNPPVIPKPIPGSPFG
jgi:hypothetical protein